MSTILEQNELPAFMGRGLSDSLAYRNCDPRYNSKSFTMHCFSVTLYMFNILYSRVLFDFQDIEISIKM